MLGGFSEVVRGFRKQGALGALDDAFRVFNSKSGVILVVKLD